MFNKQKSEALALDGYGTRLWRSNRLNKADSIYATTLVANVATVLFVLIDFICLYTVWNTVQTESSIMVALIAVGCAVCLDVPLAIAGNALKSYHQKLRDKPSTMIVIALAIITFFYQDVVAGADVDPIKAAVNGYVFEGDVLAFENRVRPVGAVDEGIALKVHILATPYTHSVRAAAALLSL